MQKSLITIGALLCISCGMQREAVPVKVLGDALNQGQKLERSSFQLASERQMIENGTEIFQSYSFVNHPDVLHRVDFDTSRVQSAIGLNSACKDAARDIFAFTNREMNNLVFQTEKKLGGQFTFVSFKRLVGQAEILGAGLDCIFVDGKDGKKLYSVINNTSFHKPVTLSAPIPSEEVKQLLADYTIDSQSGLYVPAENSIVGATRIVASNQAGEIHEFLLENDTGEVLQAHRRTMAAGRKVLMSKAYRRNYLEEDPFQAILPLTPINFSNGKVLSSPDGHFRSDTRASWITLDSERVRLFHKDNETPMRIDSFSTNENLLKIDESISKSWRECLHGRTSHQQICTTIHFSLRSRVSGSGGRRKSEFEWFLQCLLHDRAQGHLVV